ncbi:5-(carboxyamino)imidazole ribonucleotide synthase [Branchiibius cervicis]|uniref:N5-carboxyaminoimidazole ribonucleotide synthase n=1 Tax=Branchiibius cervicis TaxID=908252 RepID=A0ABW2AUK3_9MICO
MTAPRRAPGGFPVVGIIGGGQLARMCAPAAVNLDITLSVLCESADSAARFVVPSAPVGDYTDVDTVLAFARDCDVITFDHEHVPQNVLHALVEAGVAVHPSPEALVYAQDKLAMRKRLTGMGVPCPAWAGVRTAEELTAFAATHGWPVVLKTPTGGYDGKGVLLVSSVDDAADWLAHGEPLLAEEAVPFVRELAVLVARSPSGQAAAWPVVHTVQTGGICTEVLAPAPQLRPDLAARATEAALRIAGELGVTGVMAMETFELPDGGFVVNELAMRPHNSGHWTMDGAVTGQFEQHLRAVLDLPLGSPRPLEQWTVMTNVLGGRDEDLYPTYRHLMARDPGLKIHLYGKAVRPGRKIGHVNLTGTDLADLRERGRHAADYLEGTVRE